MMTETQAKPSEILQRVWDEHGAARFRAGTYWMVGRRCGCAVGNLAIELGCPRPRTTDQGYYRERYYRTILDAPMDLTLEQIETLDKTFEEVFRAVRYRDPLASREQAIAKAVRAAITCLRGIGR